MKDHAAALRQRASSGEMLEDQTTMRGVSPIAVSPLAALFAAAYPEAAQAIQIFRRVESVPVRGPAGHGKGAKALAES